MRIFFIIPIPFQVTKNFENFTETFENINEHFEKIGDHFENITEQIGTFATTLGATNTQLGQNSQKIATVEFLVTAALTLLQNLINSGGLGLAQANNSSLINMNFTDMKTLQNDEQ